jgi:phage-related tail fiber protein
MKRIILSLTVGALLSATASFADEKIHDRKENQQDRIGNGVENGSLTSGETSRLEHQESHLNKEIRADRRANGGNLTNNEKRQVNRQQNHLSREIHRDKHNGKTQ